MPELAEMSADARLQMVLDHLTNIESKLDTIATNQGTQQTEINLIKVELQGCNTKLSEIKSAVEGTLNVAIV